jgi:hypothetical protein
LEIPVKNWDEQTKPSDELNRLLKRKKKIRYQGRGRVEVRNHLDGTGGQHSPSMQVALEHLENAPCVQ